MTGVGTAAGATELGELRFEVRSVNGRGLAVRLRLPTACQPFEAAIEEAVRARLARGTVSVAAELVGPGATTLDRTRFAATAAQLRALAAELGLPQPTLADVLAAAASGGRGEPQTSQPLPERCARLLQQALDQLVQHRTADGRATLSAVTTGLDEFAALADHAATRAPALVTAYRERLLQRVQEFVAAHAPGPVPAVDLVREVAIYADRVDTAEELQRLRAHLAEFRAVLSAGGEVGRRLEFLLQELLRETNTLGAKSPDTALAHTVVAMKSALERIKEQLANLQ
ncbi:MAG: DUF1732 domain-containing protein [Planctomycetes bacterium]|nr:DUF1732 domain-containing protein [Planctomycetota bacterium]